MQFLDFEKPLEEIASQIEKMTQLGEKNKVDVSASIRELEQTLEKTRTEIYKILTPWQRVQLSRHPDRPYTQYYIKKICDSFQELHGDRNVADDKAIIAGFAEIGGKKVMIMGHQKGYNTKMRQERNFGMANPEGYRKALRLMKMAEKFNRPIVTLIDTPGAYPGLEAEERGQGEAIARNLFEMAQLKVPIICIVIGEGASGGALGIGVGDKVMMLENTWYTVISPENCSTILWRSWDFKVQAAEQLKLTSEDMNRFHLIDGVIQEPVGGAHANPKEMAARLKDIILENIETLEKIPQDKLVAERIEKFSKMGVYEEE